MKPDISVIVAVYNAEETIRKCVDSLLAQTFTNYEILLINDGSTDNCGKICDEYALTDSRIRVIHKENGGVASARQCGIKNANGDYTIHADPDDWVEPNMLEDLYDNAKKSDADMVICDFYINTYKGQDYIRQKPTNLNHDIVLKDLFRNIHGSCCNKLIKLSCYKNYNIEFPQDLSFCEDQYVIAALLKENIKVSYLPKAYYHYIRANSSSLSRKYNKQKYEEDLKGRNKFNNLLEGYDIQQEVYDKKSYSILCRAFYGGKNSFTSKEFKDIFSEYKPLIKTMKSFKAEKFFLEISCDGFYQISICIFSCILSIKHLFVKYSLKIINRK